MPTGADPVPTDVDPMPTGADPVSTGADPVSTGADPVSTNAANFSTDVDLGNWVTRAASGLSVETPTAASRGCGIAPRIARIHLEVRAIIIFHIANSIGELS
jgi:hypothetical protein